MSTPFGHITRNATFSVLSLSWPEVNDNFALQIYSTYTPIFYFFILSVSKNEMCLLPQIGLSNIGFKRKDLPSSTFSSKFLRTNSVYFLSICRWFALTIKYGLIWETGSLTSNSSRSTHIDKISRWIYRNIFRWFHASLVQA